MKQSDTWCRSVGLMRMKMSYCFVPKRSDRKLRAEWIVFEKLFFISFWKPISIAMKVAI